MAAGRPRSLARNLLSYLPLDGCIIFFNVDPDLVRSITKNYDGMVEAHKINGEFLNQSRQDRLCDMYVCLKGSLDDA